MCSSLIADYYSATPSSEKKLYICFFTRFSQFSDKFYETFISIIKLFFLLYFIFSRPSCFIYTGQLLAHLLRALLRRPRLLQVAYRTHCICILNCWVNKVQGRGDGPKASMSRASEAARVKAELDCATLWVCFAYMLKP